MTSRSEQLDKLIRKGEEVLATHRPNPPNVLGFPTLATGPFTEWQTQAINMLTNSLGSANVYVLSFMNEVKRPYVGAVEAGIGILRAAKEDIEQEDISADNTERPLKILEQICERFHLVVRQMRNRRQGRTTINVQDEYDAQDLLHSLLWLHFDDVRAEEWVPSYAGKGSRLDFLLKREQIVVEVKKTRETLGASELGSQLIEDIERYKKHPDCSALVCFAYDPEGYVANPRGIENDLCREVPFPVKVYIRPK